MNESSWPTISDSTEKQFKSCRKNIWERRLLRAIVDNLPSAVYAKDLEGRKILANADCRNSGVESEEEILGKTDFDLFPATLQNNFTKTTAEFLSTASPLLTEKRYLPMIMGTNAGFEPRKSPLKMRMGTF